MYNVVFDHRMSNPTEEILLWIIHNEQGKFFLPLLMSFDIRVHAIDYLQLVRENHMYK